VNGDAPRDPPAPDEDDEDDDEDDGTLRGEPDTLEPLRAAVGGEGLRPCFLGSSRPRTPMILRWLRFRLRSEDSAEPMAFRSAHRLPVGMDTSMLVPT